MALRLSPDNIMLFGKKREDGVHQGPFGSCCKDLADCMQQPNSLIKTSEDGTLFLTIGYVRTEQGTGWFDHAILYCPFCGRRLQDPKVLADRARGK